MVSSLVAMGGSATMGFVFKLIAKVMDNKAKQQEMLIAKNKEYTLSMDAAEQRGGVWMRRFVVVVMISLFAVLTLGVYQPTNIMTKIEPDSYLWGLIVVSNEPIISTVSGALVDETLKISILSIIAFLFGSEAA